MKLNPPLLALAIGAFGIGVTEFSPMGLLPLISTDLGVSIPVAGLLVTAYAIGVMIGAPIMTLSTGRIPRKTLLIGLMGIFTLGNFLSAISTNYTFLLIARLITSLNHGAFFGVGSVVATNLVPQNKRAGAVATMFMGLTIANVGGVPLAAWIGNVAGWRMAFWGITGLGIFAMVSLWLALPAIKLHADINMRNELKVLRRPAVLLALAVTVLSSGAMFTVFTYIAPILRDVTHVSTSFITAMLVLYGLGLTAGNWLGGRFADKSVDGTLIAVLATLAILLLVFAVTMHWPLPAAVSIFAWGMATFALVPPLQMRVMKTAADAPNVASSINIGAFNLGNALGAALGGAVISINFGYPVVAIAGAALAAGGLLLVLVSRKTVFVATLTAAMLFTALTANANADDLTLNYNNRDMIIHVPVRLPAEGSRTLVIVLHGGLGNAERIASKRSENDMNLDDVADKYGFIVAYMNGTPVTRRLGDDKKGWNAGMCCGQSAANNIDDVGYINGATQYLESEYSIDPKHIYGIGHSNGAMMTQRLMCETSLYAAAISISGALEIQTDQCPAARGKRILEIHGENDENVPLAGGIGKGLSNTDFKSQAYTQQIFINSGAQYSLDVLPGAAHQLGTIEAALEKQEGVTLMEKVIKFFNLDK